MIDSETKVVANSARLLGDAKLLAENERFASSFALAVLAKEGLGRVIIERWQKPKSLPRGNTAHVRRQLAVTTLNAGAEIAVEYWALANGPERPHDLEERVAASLTSRKATASINDVAAGFLDKTKQLSVYDDLGLDGCSADGFASEDVSSIFEDCQRAVRNMFDMRAMSVGRALFCEALARTTDRRDP